MKFSGITHEELCELIVEMFEAEGDLAECERLEAKQKKLGVNELLGDAMDEWIRFYESFLMIKMTETHMFYDAHKEDLDKELGERQREMLGMEILDNWTDESKALSAIHACQLMTGKMQGLFTSEQLHVYLHQCTLRLRASEGGLGFGDK